MKHPHAAPPPTCTPLTHTSAHAPDATIAGGQLPSGLLDEIREAVTLIEADMGKKFGDPANPLLFSVRSGAAVSGMGRADTAAACAAGACTPAPGCLLPAPSYVKRCQLSPLRRRHAWCAALLACATASSITVHPQPA